MQPDRTALLVRLMRQRILVMDGAMGAKQAKKIVKILEQARKTGTPVVAMCDSNGARVGEGAAALEAYADVFAHMARLSGVVPMIAMVLGPCVGAAACADAVVGVAHHPLGVVGADEDEVETAHAVGDRGKLEAFLPDATVRTGRRVDGRPGVRTEEVHDERVTYENFHHGSSYLEHLDFIAACRRGTAPAVSLQDGLLSVVVGVAAHRSIDEGRAVTLAEVLAD